MGFSNHKTVQSGAIIHALAKSISVVTSVTTIIPIAKLGHPIMNKRKKSSLSNNNMFHHS